MNYEKGKELVLDDDKTFIIADSFEFKNNKYLYIIDEENKKATLVKVVNDTVYEIEDDKEFDEASTELINRNMEEINKIIEETSA